MSSISCPFCRHPNPPDAKFCNDCGSVLALKPCHRCEAVNDLSAVQCHGCGVAFGEPSATAATPAAETGASAARTNGSEWVAHALETVEADFAALAQRGARHTGEAMSVPQLAAFAAARSPRAAGQASPASRATRATLAVALLAVASLPVFHGDQDGMSTHVPSLALAAAPPVRDARATRSARDNRVVDRRMPEGMQGAIGDMRMHEGAGKPGPDVPVRAGSGNGIAEVRMREGSGSRVAEVRMREGSGSRVADVRMREGQILIAPERPQSMAASKARTDVNASASRAAPEQPVPLATPESALPAVEVPAYPVASTNCTAGVAALGLCAAEDIGNEQ